MKTESKRFALFQRVALARDFPEQSLCEGDLATVVDHHPAPHGQDDGYSLEVFNAIGETIAVIVADESDIQALRSDKVLNARAWAAAA